MKKCLAYHAPDGIPVRFNAVKLYQSSSISGPSETLNQCLKNINNLVFLPMKWVTRTNGWAQQNELNHHKTFTFFLTF
jgi:hypothetical protein